MLDLVRKFAPAPLAIGLCPLPVYLILRLLVYIDGIYHWNRFHDFESTIYIMWFLGLAGVLLSYAINSISLTSKRKIPRKFRYILVFLITFVLLIIIDYQSEDSFRMEYFYIWIYPVFVVWVKDRISKFTRNKKKRRSRIRTSREVLEPQSE